MNAFGYLLSFVRWQLFCTFTFEGHTLPSDRCLWERMRGYLDAFRLRYTYAVSLKHLLYALRFEHGEIGKRPHFHCLLAGVEKVLPSRNLCFAAMARWEVWGNGFARIRLYDEHQSGCDYIVKGGEGSPTIRGANAYEVAKFGSNTVDKLEISGACWGLMCGMRNVERDNSTKLFV